MLTMKHITAYILFAALTFSPVAWAQTQVANGKIAFASDEDGDFEIYIIDSDGSNRQQLTFNEVGDYDPDWSPDGSKIAFASEQHGILEVFVMDANGANPHSLTPDLYSSDASWSPDGSKIAFDTGDIYVMNADGSGKVNLTNRYGGDYLPTWSPDGSKIYFVTDREYPIVPATDPQGADIYVMNSDGSNPTRVVSATRFPDVSPDGQSIVAGASFLAPAIILLDINGSNEVLLTNGVDEAVQFPAWSPDGNKIVYVLNWNNLAIMNCDGSGQQAILEGSGGFFSFQSPSWQPIFPPMADAGPDQTVVATNGVDALVTLDGSGSANANTYIWTVQGSNYPGTDPLRQFTLPIGVHPVTLQACDANYTNCDEDEAIMTVLAPISSTGTGLPGQYFDNSDLTGSKFFRIVSPDTFAPQHGGLSNHYSTQWG